MLGAIIVTFCKNRAKHMNYFYGKIRSFLVLWQVVHISKKSVSVSLYWNLRCTQKACSFVLVIQSGTATLTLFVNRKENAQFTLVKIVTHYA
jgi:hypothetical protein